MPDKITDNFNVKYSVSSLGAQGTESVQGALNTDVEIKSSSQGLQNPSEAVKKSVQNFENDLVAYEDVSAFDDDNNILDEIQNERSEALDKFLDYQEQIAELQRQKTKYEEEIRQHKDNPDTVRRYQGKIEALDVEIASLKESMAECEALMQSLMSEFNMALSNMINQNMAQSVQSDVPMTHSGVNALNKVSYAPNAAVSGTGGVSISGAVPQNSIPAPNYGTYSGEGIPKNVASALDARLGAGFSEKCENVAGYLGCNVNDLLAMMYSESGLKTTARNKSSNAVGLIQFIPSTLRGNGYTTEQVASMNALQQLDVVADIFMKSKKMAGYGAGEKIDGGTLYAINWLPAYAKNDVIVSNGGKYYSAGLDMNKDGSVTKADLSQRLQSKYNEMLRNI